MLPVSRLLAVLLIALGRVQAQDSAPASTSRPSEGSHRISVKVTAEGAVIAEASESVESLEGARKLVVAIGDKLEKAFDKAIKDGVTPFPVLVSIEVGATFPVSWLEVVLFDLKNSAEVVEVCQDLFFQSLADVILTIDGSVRRCPVRPFKTVGLVPASGGLAKHVLLGLEVRGDPAAVAVPHVILGRAEVVAPDAWQGDWLSLGPSRGAESRPTPVLGDGGPRPTAGDLAAALDAIRSHESSTTLRWRTPLPWTLVDEIRGSDILVSATDAHAGRRAWVLNREDLVYVGMIEVAGLPSIEDPKSASCKIIERSGSKSAPAFARGQLVVFQPE